MHHQFLKIGVLTAGLFLKSHVQHFNKADHNGSYSEGEAALGCLKHPSQHASAVQVGTVGVSGAVTGRAGLAQVVAARWTLENPDI